MLLPGIGERGQQQLAESHAIVIGCGALGCANADALARAGVGHLTLVDRDIVELTNLQRQVLFDESDAKAGLPKAQAAKQRLEKINSQIQIDAIVADATPANIEELTGARGSRERVDVIVDGLDNFETRYLLNDVSTAHAIPYVYGGAVAMHGAVYAILPQTLSADTPWEKAGAAGPDLEQIFPEPPPPGSTPTCDTAGVLGPLISIVAGFQAAEALRILTHQWQAINRQLLQIDLQTHKITEIDVTTLVESSYPQRLHRFLKGTSASETTSLCGRHAVQITPPVRTATPFDLKACSDRLSTFGPAQLSPYLVRGEVTEANKTFEITVFQDGRAIIKGTEDPTLARSLYARYVGN